MKLNSFTDNVGVGVLPLLMSMAKRSFGGGNCDLLSVPPTTRDFVWATKYFYRFN